MHNRKDREIWFWKGEMPYIAFVYSFYTFD